MRLAATSRRPNRTILLTLCLAAAVIAVESPAAGQASPALTPLTPPYASMTGDDLFSKVLKSNQARDARLQQYSAVRTYRVSNDKGKIYAQEVVRVDYQAPDHKDFRTMSEEGSTLVRDMVLKRLIESESETSSGRAHHDSAIKPANYEFSLLGEQDIGPRHCLVAQVTPKRRDKYLFEGRVWIDAQDYAIVKIAGQPAKSLSFWITRADFVRQYQKIGQFWLPASDETLVHVRLYGTKFLTIDHREYVINCGAGASPDGLAAGRMAPAQASGSRADECRTQGQQETGEGK
jgi:outer membrane lipoprotein-sorting protein